MIEDVSLAANAQVSREVREQAFGRLVQNGGSEISYLLEVGADTTADTRLRWVAIRALGQIKGVQAERVLLQLLSDPQPAIRSATLGALGDFASTEHVAKITKGLEDEAVIVRASAAEALGKLKDPTAIVALDKAINSKDNYYRGTSLWVRVNYVQALSNIGSTKAYPTLQKTLYDTDDKVSVATVAALETISGVSFAEGRTVEQEKEAWARWLAARSR